MSDVTTIEADVPERYADAVSTCLRRAADEDVVGRVWRKDGTLWGPEGTPEVTNRLGWLDIAEREREKLADYDGFAEGLRAEGYRDAVVLGMGGSSLAQTGRNRLGVALWDVGFDRRDVAHARFLPAGRSDLRGR